LTEEKEVDELFSRVAAKGLQSLKEWEDAIHSRRYVDFVDTKSGK